jgi:AhpC/TSA family
MAIATGAQAPPVEGATREGPHVLVFFKVTCGTTQLATPAIERLARAFPGRVIGVGQDPQPKLDAFSNEYGLTLPLVPDLDPYEASDGYGIVSAPTAVAVGDDGAVLDVAESWDREAWNRLAADFADALGVPTSTVSDPDDGLPDFKPG